jgi:hypothetical protein
LDIKLKAIYFCDLSLSPLHPAKFSATIFDKNTAATPKICAGPGNDFNMSDNFAYILFLWQSKKAFPT